MFSTLATEIHATAVDKGFWDILYTKNVTQEQRDIFMTKQLMMIVSEAVEVMEAIRKSKGTDEVADEMADIIIRTLDLYEGLLEHEYTDVSLDDAIAKKTRFNTDRPQKNGVKF
jgi:NTP pyrophosphatase (non-canonical NTP hydrolase)